MNLKLHKPLCVFDLETTGTNVSTDRIVEISILKVNPHASKETKTWLVNPGMPIPEPASLVHGIYDKDVMNAPIFKDIAPKVLEMIKDSDLEDSTPIVLTFLFWRKNYCVLGWISI